MHPPPRTHSNHTDKNAHRAVEAADRFKEVQNAYEVLSDKHERAWWVFLGVRSMMGVVTDGCGMGVQLGKGMGWAVMGGGAGRCRCALTDGMVGA